MMKLRFILFLIILLSFRLLDGFSKEEEKVLSKTTYGPCYKIDYSKDLKNMSDYNLLIGKEVEEIVLKSNLSTFIDKIEYEKSHLECLRSQKENISKIFIAAFSAQYEVCMLKKLPGEISDISIRVNHACLF